MHWADKVAAKADPNIPHIINDSKTPSGRVHVGSLRGPLIHDAIRRAMEDAGLDVTYRFGVDDYDPVDHSRDKRFPAPYPDDGSFEQYRGFPLCMVPPPPGSDASDMADHFISEFFDVFNELGIKCEHYRMRDVYRSGQFNEVIDTILNNGDLVRQIYYDVSRSEKSADWIPFQTVCEECGRIGTTEVVGYDGNEVEYICHTDMVSWAEGCGYRGKVSPFDGNGKLPWKLEWVAKWHTFPVTVEGAGKDHSTKGGSRDVTSACLRRIFKGTPPLNIPYEFFLVGGAKMSSSGSLGASARMMADFLPPEVLRFLMLRTLPNRPVNFSPEEKAIIKIFNDFDRFHSRTFNDPNITEDDKKIYFYSAVGEPQNYYDANFQIVSTIVQMPHLNLEEQIEDAKGSPLTDLDREHLTRRAASAKFWVDNFAEESEKTILQETLPGAAAELTTVQCAFLNRLADALEGADDWTSDALQSITFEVARTTPIQQGLAFKAIYCVLLNRGDGPKAGNLIAFLERDFVVNRFREVSFDTAEFWDATAIDVDTFNAWRTKNAAKIESVSAELADTSAVPGYSTALVEVTSVLNGNRVHLHRVLADSTDFAG